MAIKAYFDEHGLVRQQLDSFDEFITNTILEIVDDTPTINVRPAPQYGPGQTASEVRGGGRRGQAAGGAGAPRARGRDSGAALPLLPAPLTALLPLPPHPHRPTPTPHPSPRSTATR